VSEDAPTTHGDPDGYSIDVTDDGLHRVLDRRDWHVVGVYATREDAIRAALEEPVPQWSDHTMRLPPEDVAAIAPTD
jgi:hypothetical protein